MPIAIDFPWYRDEAGYDLLPAESQRGIPLRHRIVPRGGGLLTYRPFLEVPGLSRVFAGGARTAEGLLDFVRRFGPLSAAGNQPEGEDIRLGLESAGEMYKVRALSPQDRIEYFLSFGHDAGYAIRNCYLPCPESQHRYAANEAVSEIVAGRAQD